MSRPSLTVLTTSAIALALAGGIGCARRAYVIGAVCPGADGGTPIDASCGVGPPPAGTTFAVALDKSGVSFLERTLPLAAGPVAPTLRLRGEHATMTAWPSEGGGPVLTGASGATLDLGTPFTDATRAVGFISSSPAFFANDDAVGAVALDDFALEVVLRPAAGTVAEHGAGAVQWTLAGRPTGELVLTLDDGDPTHVADVVSPPLV